MLVLVDRSERIVQNSLSHWNMWHLHWLWQWIRAQVMHLLTWFVME